MTRFQLLPSIIAFTCLLSSVSTHAITNIESERLNNTNGTVGSISLSMDGRIGNSDKVAFGTSAKVIRSFRRDEIIAIVSRDYAEVDDEVNTDETFVHLRYLTKRSNQWGHEVFAQHEEDQFDILKRRSLLGAGLRYTLQADPEQQQANHIGIGAFHEEEFYQDSAALDSEKNVRLNLYWAYRNQLTDNAAYTSTFYFQPMYDQLGDEKGLWQNALTISVTSTISLSLTWDVQHDTNAPDGEDNTETNYKNVLIYNF